MDGAERGRGPEGAGLKVWDVTCGRGLKGAWSERGRDLIGGVGPKGGGA